jgi:hypothetical protein
MRPNIESGVAKKCLSFGFLGIVALKQIEIKFIVERH